MLAESGYYFVSLLTAVSFIENCDASALSNIDQEEFEKSLRGERPIRQIPEPSPSDVELEKLADPDADWVVIRVLV